MSDALNLALTITAADMFSGVLRHFRSRIVGTGEDAKKVRKEYDLMTQSIASSVKAFGALTYVVAKMRPAIAAASDLQAEMIGLRAELSGADVSAADLAKHLHEARKTAFDVQANTPFDIGQVVALEKELVKAGANIQDIIGDKGAAAAAAALATYEKMEPVLAGTALIGIGTPFKVAADGYTALADSISRAGSASIVGASEIAEAARYAAGPLAGLNRSADEMLALVAVMAKQGIVGSMAGTSLKNFFNKASELKSFKDVNGNLKSTAEIIDILRKKMEGKGDAERQSLLAKLFGLEGLPVALALLERGEGSFEHIVESMRNATPLTEKLRMDMEGFGRQMDSLKGTSKSTFAILFEPALKPLTDLIAKTNEWIALLGKASMDNEGIGKEVTYGTAGIAGATGVYAIAKAIQAGGYGMRVMKGVRGLGSVAGGVAAGAALEAAAGVTPVFVTNWPGPAMAASSVGGIAAGAAAGAAGPKIFSKALTALALLATTPLSKIGMFGAGAVATGAAGVTAAGAAGYGAGTLLYRNAIAGTQFGDKLGEVMAGIAAFFGSQEAQDARSALKGNIKIEVDDKRVRVREIRSGNPYVDYEVESGLTMGMP